MASMNRCLCFCLAGGPFFYSYLSANKYWFLKNNVMSKFIKIALRAKSIGAQAYSEQNVIINADAILTLRSSGGGATHTITLKPEYDKRIRQSVGLDERNELEYIKADNKDLKKLIED
jgi:hypothetical protein